MERPISIRSIPAVGTLQVCIGSAANPYEADVERLEEFKGNHRRYVCSGWASVGAYPQPVVAVADYKAMGFLYMQKELPYSAQSAFLVSELVVHGGVNPDSSERIAQALLDGAITSMDAGAIVRAYAPLLSPVFKHFHFRDEWQTSGGHTHGVFSMQKCRLPGCSRTHHSCWSCPGNCGAKYCQKSCLQQDMIAHMVNSTCGAKLRYQNEIFDLLYCSEGLSPTS